MAACKLQGLVGGGAGSNCFLAGVSDERAATGRSFPAVRGGRAGGADCRESKRESKPRNRQGRRQKIGLEKEIS